MSFQAIKADIRYFVMAHAIVHVEVIYIRNSLFLAVSYYWWVIHGKYKAIMPNIHYTEKHSYELLMYVVDAHIVVANKSNHLFQTVVI